MARGIGLAYFTPYNGGTVSETVWEPQDSLNASVPCHWPKWVLVLTNLELNKRFYYCGQRRPGLYFFFCFRGI